MGRIAVIGIAVVFAPAIVLSIVVVVAIIILAAGVPAITAAGRADDSRSAGCAPAALVVIVRIAVADVAWRNPDFAGRRRSFPPARSPHVVLYAAVVHVIAGNPYEASTRRPEYDLAPRPWRTDVDIEMELRERRKCKGQKTRKYDRLKENAHGCSFFPVTLSNKLSNRDFAG